MRLPLCVISVLFISSLLLAGQVTESKTEEVKQTASDEQRLKAAKLPSDGESLLAFLKTRTLTEADQDRAEILITQLGAGSFKVREQATVELISKGTAVLSLLRQGLEHPDLEVQRRCATCIQKIKDQSPPELSAAVARLIAVRKPAGAIDALLGYLPFADHDGVADEVRDSLTKLASVAPIEPLVAALSDKLAVRRAAAGEALIRAAKHTPHIKALRALMGDGDAMVRWRVANALVIAKEKEAVPVLIDLLPAVPLRHAWQIEDILQRLADDKSAPVVSLGADDAGRKQSRDAWQAWWKQHGEGVDLAALTAAPRLLGYTTMILLDQNRIIEVDGSNNLRWQIDGVEFPLDVQVLSGERVLVAEYQGNKVTERNFKGEILWQCAFEGPQMAQRLPNGNTFIAGKHQILEVDAKGKEVFVQHILRNDGIMKCMKAPTGEVVCLFEDGRVVRLDAKGRELSSFRVELSLRLFGGRIHALAKGRVLIPFHDEHKVVEYDSEGKAVWQVKIDQPITATRLSNGNTLVTSMSQNRAVEFDRNGNEVWSYQQETRITRALRR